MSTARPLPFDGDQPAQEPPILPFQRPETAAPDDLKLTLRDAFEKHMAADLEAEKSASTVGNYRTALSHWERLTRNPPIGEATDETMAVLRRGLLAEEKTGHSIMDVRKCLRAIFRRLGPRSDGNPRGKRILDVVPYMEPVPTGEGAPRKIPLETLSAIYEACRVADWPSGCLATAPFVWRVAFVLLYCHGPRRSELLGLEWSMVSWEPAHPHPLVDLDNPHGWLTYTPPKTQGHKGALYRPLTEVSRWHLAQLHAVRGERRKVFGWPASSGTGRRPQTREAIQRAARIENPYTFQHFRQTCNMAYRKIDREAAEAVMGHAPRDVNSRWYWQSVEAMIEAAAQLPQPDAFERALLGPVDDPQRRLFG